MHSIADITQSIKDKTLSLGVDLVNISDCSDPETYTYYQDWISKGYHGKMSYLERHLPLKKSVNSLLDGAKSIIVIAKNYYHPLPYDGYKIARYAGNKDYHRQLKKILSDLAGFIKGTLLNTDQEDIFKYKICVDSSPLLERDVAQRSGIGWIGKNTLIINKNKGSWLLLGFLLVNIELQTDTKAKNHCSTCTKCIDACPTHAIIEPYKLDATRCISYHTIESREETPKHIEDHMGEWIFGCDICQEVCPWNKRAESTLDKAYLPNETTKDWPLSRWLLGEDAFEQLSRGKPIRRSGFKKWVETVSKLLQKKKFILTL